MAKCSQCGTPLDTLQPICVYCKTKNRGAGELIFDAISALFRMI